MYLNHDHNTEEAKTSMTTQQQPGVVSLFYDDLAEGGGPPVGLNLTIQSAVFTDFNYGGASPMVSALKLNLLTDEGQVHEQHYSLGPKERVNHTADGKRLTGQPSKTSNFGVLMKGMSDAGLGREFFASGDIMVLNGLYAYWDGVTIPRTGLPGVEGTRQTVVSVPTKIHRMPGQLAAAPVAPTAPAMTAGSATPPPPPPTGGAPAATAPPVGMAPPPSPAPAPATAPPPAAVAPAAQEMDATPYLTELLGLLPADFTKQDMMVQAYTLYAGNTDVRDFLSHYIYEEPCDALLATMSRQVNGDNVSYVPPA